MKDGLIFDWPGRHHLHLILPAALVAAGVMHACLFFLFSIIYPSQESGAVGSAAVFYVPAGSPESSRLSGLLQSADPAVFAPGRGLPPADGAGSGDYTPQYDTARAVLDPLPAVSTPAPRIFSATGPVPVFVRDRFRQSDKPPLPSVRLTATGALAGRAPVLPPDAGLQPSGGSDPGSAVFLVAVRADGSVAHLFSQQSSGNEELDRKSAGILRALRFSEGPGDPAWGAVTFQWGIPSPP
ncbi:MAG: hypothetical protein WCQ16_02585 [Verrucomicrobiae bacterium]